MPSNSSLITDYDIYLFSEGSHYRTYEKFGAHLDTQNGIEGVHFALWAPNAKTVAVIGDFNQWSSQGNLMKPRGSSGVWELFIPKLKPGALYKYAIQSKYHHYSVEKSDPYAFSTELRPSSASKVWDLSGYQWNDQDWMDRRVKLDALKAPISIYEMHLGSWMRMPEEDNRWLTYRELAPQLAKYLQEMGYTHVEFMPLMEHPFDGSWGYQVSNYYAPTSRFGTPQDFMFLIDTLHQAGIGVILDWVPSHFPKDIFGLGYFDGTHLYEHADSRQGEHQEWGTLVFNYGRNEVSNFLLSNALFWLEKYHVDGLRVDAVASMIYLDYSRKTWIPNRFGGRENLEAIEFLQRFNTLVYGEYPGVITIAEESTAWPMVSKPVYLGGLGFGFKWDMGWMHDALAYFALDPIFRKYHHHLLTFRALYAYHENFVLALSHDEVVHGKASLLSKMPGDNWQKFANLRLLFGYMYALPGKKLHFMGAEFGQWKEWNHDQSLDFHLLQYELHHGLKRWIRDLNTCYRGLSWLHELDSDPDGFAWLDCSDAEQSIISFVRKAKNQRDQLLFVCNFTPVTRYNYRVGVPREGYWQEILNSDAKLYGGSGQGNMGGLEAAPIGSQGHFFSLNLVLPPLGMVVLRGPVA